MLPDDRERDETAASPAVLAAALGYAAAGLPVLPLNGKLPRNSGGLTNASTDPAVIAEWWRRWPDANVGIRTGAISGLLVLDVDTPKGGAGTLAELERRHGKIPPTARVLTGSGGEHVYFRHPGGEVRNSAGRLGDGLDLRADRGYIVAPPSVHACGRPYLWTRTLERGLAEPPAWLLEDAAKRKNGAAPNVAGVIAAGKRNSELASLAGTMRRRGMAEDEIAVALAVVNANRCRPPLTDSEVRAIAASVATYTPDPAAAIRTTPDVAPRPIDDVHDVFRRWLHLPDPGVLYVTCAAVAANRVPAFDPTWIIVVGPAGVGKTETITSTSQLGDVHVVATLTEAALLSGTPRKDAATDASGGLLRELGPHGIVVLKDFGSILSMHRDGRAAVLAALREVYDGSWTRLVGVDGGRRLHWEGRVGLLAGATSVLDSHHAVMSQLGERFLIYRLNVDDTGAQARSSLAHHGREREMRRELGEAVAGLFAGLNLDDPPPLAREDVDRLVSLSQLVAKARSPVVRDSYRRELELIPDSEAPARLVGALARVLTGLRLIGVGDDEAWRVTTKLGLDSMPATRRQAFELILGRGEPATTTDVATTLGLPTATSRRVLEELAAHHVLRRESQGEGKADLWHVQPWAADRHREATFSEKSDTPINPFQDLQTDKTEKVGTP